MTEKIKTRNMRHEYKYSFFWNVLTVLAVIGLAVLVLPFYGPIGIRTMVAMYLTDGFVMMLFMYLMEKYSITTSGMNETVVITVLSSVYTFCVMELLNLIFFTSMVKLLADFSLMVIRMIGICLVDGVVSHHRNNKNRHQKSKLLIISSKADDFYRMKRIKYGVLNNYDSWYESVEDYTEEAFLAFAKEKFSEYDAICVLDGLSDWEYQTAVAEAMERNKDLFIVPKLIDVGKTNARLVRFDDVLTLYMPRKSLNRIELCVKRVIDIVLASVGLVIAAVPMLILAAAIKITSPGPVFYKQVRLTKDKKEFEIYKFRTMIPDAEKLSGPKFAEKDDPRITPIGKVLRACRLDELPQIINILKGDMSVVGPRPERPVFVEQFEKEIENYDDRFAVKAGLTSLSHVYGRYSTYIHDRTYYDLFYITHYSLFLDLKIILLTTKTIFMKSAAEGEDDFKEKTVAETNQEVNVG